jgi:hypothetical protein
MTRSLARELSVVLAVIFLLSVGSLQLAGAQTKASQSPSSTPAQTNSTATDQSSVGTNITSPTLATQSISRSSKTSA